MVSTVKHLLFGNPLTVAQAKAERLGIPLAFVLVAANALSSVAYASEEILRAFQGGGVSAQGVAVFVSLAILGLMLIVTMSYDRVIRSYPQGGGAYVVARENLGTMVGVVAGASLLVDYTLTVAVSVTAGAAAIVSAFPEIVHHRIEIAVGMVGLLVFLSLRGTRQSAQLLAPPVYLFVISMFVMICVGLIRYFTEGVTVVPDQRVLTFQVQGLSLLLLIRAFASGSVALTGVEAVSNSLGVFKPPETRHARLTLLLLGVLLAMLFLGISSLAFLYRSELMTEETLVSQVARVTFGTNALYYIVQFSTLVVLIIAANTSFVAFPQLAAKLARDGLLPRPLTNLGDRFVYNYGILVLGGLSTLLVIAFFGEVHLLLPLYAIGVFIGFTLTQAGIAVHVWKRPSPGSLPWFLVAAVGAVVTGIVTLVFLVVKFTDGAWMVAVAIPVILALFWAIRSHYSDVARALSIERYSQPPGRLGSQVVVPIGGVHRAVLPALEHARALGGQVRAVHVSTDEEVTQNVQRRWAKLRTDIPLIVLPAARTGVVEPLIEYIHMVAKSHPNEYVTVVLPEFVPKRWWHRVLHNRTATLLKRALHTEKRVIVTNVPYHLPR
ncbi:MAG: APC family permease [SAR202 cluster bacterium]|nr:APC family permease [SAR202 cluster bacterium]